jgi:trk system potassium uptake protein
MKKKFAVLGLGHFGMNLSLYLTNMGADVVAVDNKESNAERLRDKVSFAAIADVKDLGALRGLGLEDMDAVIVAIGEDFEASILATANLQEIGVKRIINRVVSPTHEKLLKLMKVDDLILPEADAAQQLANKLIRKGVLEYLELSKDYSIVEIKVPDDFVGRSLGELDLRKNFKINLVTVIKQTQKRNLIPFTGGVEEIQVLGVPESNYTFAKDDVLVVFGSEDSLKRLLS